MGEVVKLNTPKRPLFGFPKFRRPALVLDIDEHRASVAVNVAAGFAPGKQLAHCKMTDKFVLPEPSVRDLATGVLDIRYIPHWDLLVRGLFQEKLADLENHDKGKKR